MTFGEPFFGISWIDIIIRVLIVVTVMTLVVMYLTYGERKVVARFQQRLGPTRTGPAGLLQAFADTVKLVTKEDIRPANADRWIFEFAPYLTFIPVFVVLVTLPFAQDWGIRNMPLGIFFVFALLSLNIVGVMMAGLGSGNKYALLGGVRAVAQMVSYEIPMVLALLAVVIIAGTLDLNLLAAQQGAYAPFEDFTARPYVLVQPLAFLIFFTAMLSELHRAPFDIPVAESEISGGYFIEYSGIRWSLFQLTEYAALWGFSVFGSVIFFGGWALPNTESFFGPDWAWQLGITFIKSLIFIIVVMWVRVTVPRLRADQLMNFSWKVLLPASIAQLLVNGLFMMYEWPQELLALTNWAGAALLIGFIVYRAGRSPKTARYVGAYRQAGVVSR